VAPPRALPVARLVGIGTGGLALAAIWGTYNVFMPLLLGDFVESRALRGAIMGLDNVVAILLIPVVGAWSDRVDGRWGRRLPFLLVGVPLAALTFAGLPWAATALWTLLLLDIAFLLSITLYRAPLVALLPDHVAPEQRAAGNGIITLMAALGGVVALVLIAPTFDVARVWPFAAAALLALGSLAVVVVSAERHPAFVAHGAVQADAPLLRGLLRDLRELIGPAHRGPAWLLLGLFFCFFGFAAVEAQFSVYATETLGLTGGAAGRCCSRRPWSPRPSCHRRGWSPGWRWPAWGGRSCSCPVTRWWPTRAIATASASSPGCTTCSVPAPPSSRRGRPGRSWTPWATRRSSPPRPPPWGWAWWCCRGRAATASAVARAKRAPSTPRRDAHAAHRGTVGRRWRRGRPALGVGCGSWSDA